MLLTIDVTCSQCCKHTESVYPNKSSEEQVQNIEVLNIIHWCGARQLALFLTLEHCENMLA